MLGREHRFCVHQALGFSADYLFQPASICLSAFVRKYSPRKFDREILCTLSLCPSSADRPFLYSKPTAHPAMPTKVPSYSRSANVTRHTHPFIEGSTGDAGQRTPTQFTHAFIADSPCHKSGLGRRNASNKSSSQHSCSRCRLLFQSRHEVERHLYHNPKFCAAHRKCHASWTEHVNRYSHTTCPLPPNDCPRALSGTRYEKRDFLNHFRSRHL